MRFRSIPLPVLLLVTLATPPAYAVVWMRNSAMADFTDSDMTILTAEVRRVLDSVADGERVDWRNDATGNRGALKPLMTFRYNDQECRRLAALNVSSKGKRGVVNYNLCRQDDGTWKLVSDMAVNGRTGG